MTTAGYPEELISAEPAKTNLVINEHSFIDVWSRASKLPNEVIYKFVPLIL